jgi:hypothetical protein
MTYPFQIPPQEHLADQLRSAYDAYLAIQRGVTELVNTALGRTEKQLSTSHRCPPCFYPILEDLPLTLGPLMAFDGNNSLKLVDTAYRHGTVRSNDRMLKDPRWIEDEEVDKYKDEVKNSTKVCFTI